MVITDFLNGSSRANMIGKQRRIYKLKIGLIIYSLTGNTKNVAVKLKDKLSSAGHSVSLEEIKISGNTPAQPGKFQLTTIPDIDTYDQLIFGAPVQALSLNPVMKTYLKQLPELNGKIVACYVTKYLPLLWFGGTGAISAMKKICESKGAQVLGTEIVVWAESKREKTITRCIENLSRLF